MFTASHNPAAYNGIKLCRAGARPVGQDTGLAEVRELAQAILDGAATTALATRSEPPAATTREPSRTRDPRRLRRVPARLWSTSPASARCGSSSTPATAWAGSPCPPSSATAAGLPALPLEIVPLYFELDGNFPNHEANPLDPENLVDLQAAVVAHGADIGLAFDGDADRCFVIDERGEPCEPERDHRAGRAREIAKELAAGRDVTVVYNVICSARCPRSSPRPAAPPVRTRVGPLVHQGRDGRPRAVFGGEHSAHYYFRDFWFADTGMLAAMHVLAALGEQDGPLARCRLTAQYERYRRRGEINSTVADVGAATAAVRPPAPSVTAWWSTPSTA